jgi:hypothetical protein
MVLYQCDVCGGICLENQIVFITVQIGESLFLCDLCPTCFSKKFGNVKLKQLEIVNEDGGDDEKSFRN